ncbi:phage GP46 family protein [Leeia sp. TBRC 13508]|uniref:Phage GP46 family protein n=1 Tax=Leeia speluncae TaxID=2884804 RepID=A0ABS8D286_9NEIS|nr:phage GP46 family protein [Leeia speluncae]MCB6182304.1 phage GP46 family protein [Leeia speluncae]
MDKALNPYTGDYTGQLIDTLANAVYIRLMTPLGSWWADIKLGSRLHELQRQKDLSRVSQLAKQYAEEALKPLLQDGRATQILITPEQLHDGWLRLAIAVTDAQGRTNVFSHPVKVV